MRGLLHLAVCASSATVVLGQLDMGTCKCENGGVCLGKFGTLFEEDAPLTEESEQCLCAAGWRGYLCQEDQDECRSAPCVHGTCQDALGISEYSCQCDGGFSGYNCAVNDDDCASFPCQHGGTCIDGADTYICVCSAGFQGDACEEPRRLEPVWRDVRGAYGVDASRHVLLNPVSRANVGIGLTKPREQLHIRGDTATDSLTAPKLAVMASQHSQSSSTISQQDILSLKTLMPRTPRGE